MMISTRKVLILVARLLPSVILAIAARRNGVASLPVMPCSPAALSAFAMASLISCSGI